MPPPPSASAVVAVAAAMTVIVLQLQTYFHCRYASAIVQRWHCADQTEGGTETHRTPPLVALPAHFLARLQVAHALSGDVLPCMMGQLGASVVFLIAVSVEGKSKFALATGSWG